MCEALEPREIKYNEDSPMGWRTLQLDHAAVFSVSAERGSSLKEPSASSFPRAVTSIESTLRTTCMHI